MNATAIGVALVVVAALVVESVAQVCLKLGASNHGQPPYPAWVGRLGTRGWIALGVGAYVVEVGLYTAGLHFLDVSLAFPLGSLCFVGVTVLSRWFLGEAVSQIRWLGVGLIIAGSALVTWQ